MIPATDIDIDCPDRDKILQLFKTVPAMIIDKNKNKIKHTTGVYFHEMPVNPFTGLSTIDYKTAEDQGFFKIDVLNLGIYQGVKDNAHLNRLMNTEPVWELFEHADVVNRLFHLGNHSHIVCKLKPTTVEQLAAVLAIIRPAKRYLSEYTDWNKILNEVWVKPADNQEVNNYYFKKAHAISYAFAVIVQLNLMCEDV